MSWFDKLTMTYHDAVSDRVMILGVPIDPVTEAEAVARIRAMLAADTVHHVMTPNSEMLVEACRDASFRNILAQTSLNLPDSTGLLFAARMTGQSLPARVTGVDTVTHLCRELGPDEPVFLLGAAEDVAERAAAALREINPRLNIVGTYAGSPRSQDAPAIVARIAHTAPKLLLVAYGAPAQDQWIARHLPELPSVRVAMGVGGTFDFLAGTRKRAPRVLRAIGLEWLWRLILEPRRIGRIWRAVVVFPWLVLRYGKRVL